MPPVVKDTKFQGAKLLRELLEALDEADDTANQAYELTQYEWKEVQQRSAENNAYIWNEVVELSRPMVRRASFLRNMIDLTVNK